MPNIDTSSIENFDAMTAEEKLDAVLKLEIPESVDMSRFVSKETFDKKASEAADWKNKANGWKDKHDALISDDEKKKQAEEEEKAELLAKLEALEKQNTVAKYTNAYIALGYDKALAEETAKAMADGDMEKVFSNGEKHKTALEKKIREDLMNRTPKPDGAGVGDKPDDSDIAKAKELARAKHGGDKSYDEIMNKYK